MKHSVATLAWQLAFIHQCCRYCTQFRLLTLKWRLSSIWPPYSSKCSGSRFSPKQCFWQTILIDVNCYKCSLFFFPANIALKSLWGSHFQRSSWPAPDPLMFHAPEVVLNGLLLFVVGNFSYAKINDCILRWKDFTPPLICVSSLKLPQHIIFPLSLTCYINQNGDKCLIWVVIKLRRTLDSLSRLKWHVSSAHRTF